MHCQVGYDECALGKYSNSWSYLVIISVVALGYKHP